MPQHTNGTVILRAACGLLVLLLAACGGGGGSAGSGGSNSGSGGGGSGTGTSVPPPTFGSLTFKTNENIPLQASVTATDTSGGTITFAQTGMPAHGTVTSFASGGAFVYQPAANYTGGDSFTVAATDSDGGTSAATVSITVTVNHPPVASNDVLRADGTALNSINVLAGAQDPDGDPLTLSIETQPPVGKASINQDGTVAITGLPAGFKGVTRFAFRVTDPSAAYAVANVAVFVGADPFRVAFAGDPSGEGAPEVYLTDFVSKLAAATAATQGNMRLRGFAVSGNGATIAYRREDSTAPSTTDLSFVQTSNTAAQVHIVFPNGAMPMPTASGADQYQVSPDGKWIAAIAGSAGAEQLYVLNVASPVTVTAVSPPGTHFANAPRFTDDSLSLYFLASPSSTATNRTLYVVGLSALGTPATQVSKSPAAGSAEDVLDYSVAPDQSRILLQAHRGDTVGLYYVDPAHLQTESIVSQALPAGAAIISSTMDLPPGQGGAARGERVAYTVFQPLGVYSAYVAEVSDAPNPRLAAGSGAIVLGLRPDDAALLYTEGGQVYENVIDSGITDQLLGVGGTGWYDSTGNIVLLEQYLPVPGGSTYYPSLAVTERGTFGTTQPLGIPNNAAQYINVTGFDRAVVVLGEGPIGSPAKASVPLALFNALAPTTALYLSDTSQSGAPTFSSPMQLSSNVAEVVTY